MILPATKIWIPFTYLHLAVRDSVRSDYLDIHTCLPETSNNSTSRIFQLQISWIIAHYIVISILRQCCRSNYPFFVTNIHVLFSVCTIHDQTMSHKCPWSTVKTRTQKGDYYNRSRLISPEILFKVFCWIFWWLLFFLLCIKLEENS